MTAPHARPVRALPDPDGTDDLDAGATSAETIAAQWEPEGQLAGALLWHTAATAKPAEN